MLENNAEKERIGALVVIAMKKEIIRSSVLSESSLELTSQNGRNSLMSI